MGVSDKSYFKYFARLISSRGKYLNLTQGWHAKYTVSQNLNLGQNQGPTLIFIETVFQINNDLFHMDPNEFYLYTGCETNKG